MDDYLSASSFCFEFIDHSPPSFLSFRSTWAACATGTERAMRKAGLYSFRLARGAKLFELLPMFLGISHPLSPSLYSIINLLYNIIHELALKLLEIEELKMQLLSFLTSQT